MSANGRGSFIAVAIFFLAACATPDLQPFATQTANLTTAVNAEQATVSGKFSDLEALALMGQQQGWGGAAKGIGFDPQTYVSLGQDYDKTARALSEIFMAATSYSQALVNLAASGANGKAAVDKLSSSLGGVTSALSLTNPISLIGSAAKDVLAEVVGIVQLMQSQKSLKKVMGVVESKDLTGRMAAAVEKIYGDVDQVIFRNLARTEKGLKLQQFGLAKRNAANHAAKALARRYEMIGKIFSADAQKPECSAPLAANPTVETLRQFTQSCFDIPDDLKSEDAQLVSLVAEAQALGEELTEVDAWRDLHLSQSANIVAAVKLWAKEHASVYGALKKCGGFRVLKPACGQLNFANLGAAAQRIKGLALGLRNDRKESSP